MYVLDKLWRDGISPSERLVRSGSDYQKASTQRNTEMKRLLDLLTPEAKKQLEVVEELKYDMTIPQTAKVTIVGKNCFVCYALCHLCIHKPRKDFLNPPTFLRHLHSLFCHVSDPLPSLKNEV